MGPPRRGKLLLVSGERRLIRIKCKRTIAIYIYNIGVAVLSIREDRMTIYDKKLLNVRFMRVMMKSAITSGHVDFGEHEYSEYICIYSRF